jgi:hypothetical protein
MVPHRVGVLGRSVLLVMSLASCGGPTSPSQTINELDLAVATPEEEAGRFLLVVGDSGSVSAIAFGSDPLFGEIGVDPGKVSYQSSAPSVVGVSPLSQTTTRLKALMPGSAAITGRAQGLVAAAVKPIVVTSTPLPIDSLRVGLAPVSSGIGSTLDSVGVLHITVPVRTGAALWFTITRAGAAVLRIPFTLASSNPGVARVDYNCLPVELDPTCGTFSQWGWVTGVASGHATVVVTVRNKQVSFVVDVP